MNGSAVRPAYYAAGPGRRWREWWTLLHPPYTAWHLSYVVIGASLAARGAVAPLYGSLVAFFLAVGIGAHALDELNGRPLRTSIPNRVLAAAAIVSVAGAVTVGAIGVLRVGPVLVPFIVVGAFFVVAYNLELFGGLFHNDAAFSLGWGSFPLLTTYVAEARSLSPAAVLAATAAFFLSAAQRSLSTRARFIRRSLERADGEVVAVDGSVQRVDAGFLLAPVEQALSSLSWFVVALAAALALERFA